MNQELEIKLINKHWILNKSLNTDPRLPFPMFGIECGDGWYKLLDKLCTKIEYLIENKYPYLKDSFYVDQIKEKYGTLRFYVTGANEEILDIIDEYEDVSSMICEICSKQGELRQIKGWYITLCEEHRKERE